MFNSLTNMGLSHYVSRREGNVASQSHPIMVDPHVADGRNRRDGRSAQGCTRAADEALSASKRTTLHLLPCYLRELFTRFIHPVSTHRTRTPRGVHRDATTSTSSSSPAGQGRFYLVSLTPYHAAACLPVPLPRADPSQLCLSARAHVAAAPLRHAAWRLQSYRSARIFVAACCFRLARPLLFFPVRSAPEGPAVRRTFTEPETPVGLHPTHMTSHHACLASCSDSCRVCF